MNGLDLQELIRQNKPIYVMNKTGRYLNEPGPYVLEIKDSGNKRAAQVIIPATKYPFLVSAHVPAKLLADSTEFYSALSKGILELVDPDKAREVMQSPVAQKVQENALRKFQPVKRDNRNIPPELLGTGDRPDHRPPGADRGISGLPQEQSMPLVVAETKGEEADPDSDVSPRILQLVMDLQSDKDLYEEKFLDLDGMENLTALDYGYLLSNCRDFPKIVQLAKTALSDLVGEDGVEEIEAEQEIEEAAPKSRKRRKRRK